MSYSVDLVDFPGLPESTRVEAEARYRRVLEKKLGGARNVSYYLRAFINATESIGNDVSNMEYEAAAAFMTAQEAAQEAGFEGLGDVDSAYFDVRL